MDSLFLYIESNGIFIMLLLVLLINLGRSSSVSVDERLFRRAIVFNICVLIADTGTWIFDGRIFLDTIWLNKIVFFAYYVLTTIFVYVWALYSAYKLQVNWKLFKKYEGIIAIPCIVALIIAIVSLWNGCLFTFDSAGTYIRGELFLAHTGILWLYLWMSIVSVVSILMSEKREELFKQCIAMIISVIFPVVGGLLQTLFYGLNLAWTGSCVSLVIMFISLQNRQIVMDALTQVHNRGSFERTLRETIDRADTSKGLYLLMIDINKFKSINDTYGHIAGDRALITVAKTLDEIVQGNKNDFLARYGGDEFVILCSRKEKCQVDWLINKIKQKCKTISKDNNLDFDISISVGCAKYDSKTYDTAEKFIAAADVKMYVDKNASR